MLNEPVMTGDFHADLKTMLPRLRVYALSLTRDRDRADDLLQQTVVKALAGRASFGRGTNLAAWLIRIQRNEFISNLRRDRPTVCFDEVILNSLSHPPVQESGLVMREFRKAFGCLPDTQREALLLVVLEGWSHEQIAAHCAVSVGTVKSRIWRARRNLRELLADRGSTGDASDAGSGGSRAGAAIAAVTGSGISPGALVGRRGDHAGMLKQHAQAVQHQPGRQVAVGLAATSTSSPRFHSPQRKFNRTLWRTPCSAS